MLATQYPGSPALRSRCCFNRWRAAAPSHPASAPMSHTRRVRLGQPAAWERATSAAEMPSSASP
jgi:hypothetical protein